MKLLYCRACKDIQLLSMQPRTCHCGKSTGRYLDKIQAEVAGESAVVLGIDNHKFNAAMLNYTDTSDPRRGINFDAFIIPKLAPTVTWVTQVDSPKNSKK